VPGQPQQRVRHDSGNILLSQQGRHRHTPVVHRRQSLVEDIILLLPRVVGWHHQHLRRLARVTNHLPYRHWHTSVQFQELGSNSVPQSLEQPLLHVPETVELLCCSATARVGVAQCEPLAGPAGELLVECALLRMGLFCVGPLLQALSDITLKHLG
jgi:hypothetical protein